MPGKTTSPPTETDAQKKAREAKEKALATMTFAEANSDEVNRLLARGVEMDEEKEKLFRRISANRDILRNYANLGDMSREQAESYLDLYPIREVNRTAKAGS